jgi:hypothetical protein
VTRTQPLDGSYGETRASPSSLENQTYPPPAASAPSPILGMGPISSEATMCIFGADIAPFATPPVFVPQIASGATYHQNGHQEGPHHGYEVSLANHGAPAFYYLRLRIA